MKRRNFFDQLGQSSTATTIALLAVVAVWTLVFLAIIGGIIFFVERPIQAQQPTVSVPTPVISVEPAAGAAGTTITIYGQGWTPGNDVSIYLVAPGQTQIPNFASAGATADTQGEFTVSVVIPSEDGWQTVGAATIIGRTIGGGPSAQAPFNVLAPSEQPTATPTLTTPSTPTPTPTQPSTPTPTPTPAIPRATARVNLNIRSGPGIAYPVVGVLLAGQSAPITGISADGNWWQISFAGAASGRGWIAAYYVTAENTQNVPVVEAPPLPPKPTPIPQPPTAVISGPTAVQVGQSVTFDGSGSSASTGSIVHYEWAFSDGTIANGVTVSHTYQQGGTYVVTLTVTDSQGLLGSTTQAIQIGQPSPTAVISGPKQGTEGQSITFDGSDSSANFGNIVDYEWDFGDGTSASGSSVTHVYTQPRHYKIVLTVTNSAGLTDSTTHKIQIEAAPTAMISASRTGQVGQPVTFDGSGSTGRDNHIASYAWNFGDGTTTKGVTVSHIYRQVGSYQVSLTVTDAVGATATATQIIQIEQSSPTAVISILTTGLAGQPITFDGSNSSAGVGQIVKYEWNFGDGTTGTGARVVHTYTKAGSYTITLTVTNSDGLIATATQVIQIEQLSPTAVIVGPATGVVNQPIAFDGSGSSANVGQIVQYEWNFGDGSTGSGAQVTHAYAKAGSYKVSLTVADSNGATATAGHSIQIGEAVTAVISGPATGAVDQPITFDGSGSSANVGQIVQYEWNFGDGTTGSGVQVTHAYTKAGTYKVTLTVTDSNGATAKTGHTIQIGEAVTAVISGPATGAVDQPITFDGSGSSANVGQIVQYEWNFGDGGTGSGAQVTHAYAKAGSYKASLTVTDSNGATATAGHTIQIEQPPSPTAVISGPMAGVVNQPIAFDGSGSSANVGQIVQYEWNFGDGGTGSGAQVTHVYAKAGSYKVTLTATASNGATATATQVIQIEQPPSPTAVISGPTAGVVNQPVAFDGSGSSVNGGNIVQYEWNFGDGSSGSGAQVTHVYAKAGSYKVTLTVTDSNGATATATQVIQIEQPPSPTAVISGPTAGVVNQPVAFDGSGFSVNGGNIVQYEWNFGDGGTDSGATVTHAYTKAGTYKVTLTVTDSNGATATAGHTIQIEQPPSPTAVISGPTTGRVGQAVAFEGSGSSANVGQIVQYEWNFGDGSTGSGAQVTHAYAKAGSYKVTLTVTDSNGATATAGHSIQIKRPSPAAPGQGSSTSPSSSRPATPPPTSGKSSSTNGTSGRGAPAAGSRPAPHTSRPGAKKSHSK